MKPAAARAAQPQLHKLLSGCSRAAGKLRVLQQLHTTQETHIQLQWIHALIFIERKVNLKLSLVAWPRGVGGTYLKQSSTLNLVDTSTCKESIKLQLGLLEPPLIPAALPALKQHRDTSPASNQPGDPWDSRHCQILAQSLITRVPKQPSLFTHHLQPPSEAVWQEKKPKEQEQNTIDGVQQGLGTKKKG